jgi:2-dehydro-3-deoxygalactonokinase
MTSRYIAIDWGSTNLRAWLYQGEQCLESRQSEAGVTRLNGKSPEAVLAEVTQNWRDSATPVVMAGMVGSNVGWKTAPYLPVPAHFSAIGEQLTSVGDNIWIIPGLCVSRDDNHNVMRGEETQLLARARFLLLLSTSCPERTASGSRRMLSKSTTFAP